MRYAICYLSTEIKNLDQSEVVQILYDTETRNNNFGVNGLLVYSEGNFFEVIEGEKEKIIELYNLILKDSRHTNIILLFQKDVNKSLFKDNEAIFLSENMLYRSMEIDNFRECIQDLDDRTQDVVNKMLLRMGS